MSEIINSPLIFLQQEVKDRFQLHRFIDKLFEPCKTDTGNLVGLPAEELYHVYKMQYPMNVLNEAIVSNMLLTGGFVDQENPEQSVLYANINETYFMNLKKEAQMCILPYIKEPMAMRFRQLILGIRVVNNDNALTLQPSFLIKNFVEVWTLNRNNADSYMHAFTPEYRSAATDVYNYYRVLSCIYKWPTVDKNIFQDVLTSLGYKCTKGRVYGKAGMRYYTGLFIPRTIEDRVLSVDMNMCCIFNGNTHWTRHGLLEHFIEAQKQEICMKNLERMGFNEQERAQIEKEKAEFDVRRTFETGEVPLGQATTTYETQDNLGHNGGSVEESQTPEAKTVQTKFEDTIPRTSGFKEAEVKSAADLAEPLEIGESYRDRYAQFCADVEPECESEIGLESNNERIGGDTIEGDGPSIEEIASALTIPYTMSVATGFTKEVMANWLQKMNIPEPEKVLEHYDDIMEILVNT